MSLEQFDLINTFMTEQNGPIGHHVADNVYKYILWKISAHDGIVNPL